MRDSMMQQAFIRVFRDSGYRIDAVRAAILVGMMLHCHPLQVWLAMPSLDVMNAIAAGEHPACGTT